VEAAVKVETSRSSAAPATDREVFVERKRSEQMLRDLSCKAICSIKRGLRQHGVQHNGKPFMPKTWDKVFKPMLGSYIKFLLTRPDQFRVAEGRGPGLYTVENVAGNATVVAPSWEELAAAKGKGKAFEGKGKGKGKGESKGKGKEAKGQAAKGKGNGMGKGVKVESSSANAPWRSSSAAPRLVPRPPSQPPPASLAAALSTAFDEATGLEDEEVFPEEEEAFEAVEGEHAEVDGLDWAQADQQEEGEDEEEMQDEEVEAEAEAEWAHAAELETEDVLQPETETHGSLISSLLSGGDLFDLGRKRSHDYVAGGSSKRHR